MRTQSPLSRSETRFLHTLYQSYAGPLYRVAHHRLGDPYLAQDLVQTVFLAAAEKLPTLRRHENPWAWLLRALHYELSHTYTKLARERQRLCPLDQAEATTSAPPPTLGLADILPAQLTDREREILLLYYEEGLSYQEIAARFEIPVSTCGTWLSRAKKHCRALLSAGTALAFAIGLAATLFLSPGTTPTATEPTPEGCRALYSMVTLEPAPVITPIRADLPVEVILNDQPFFLPADAELFHLPFFNAKDDTLDTPPTTLNSPTPPSNK